MSDRCLVYVGLLALSHVIFIVYILRSDIYIAHIITYRKGDASSGIWRVPMPERKKNLFIRLHQSFRYGIGTLARHVVEIFTRVSIRCMKIHSRYTTTVNILLLTFHRSCDQDCNRSKEISYFIHTLPAQAQISFFPWAIKKSYAKGNVRFRKRVGIKWA